MLTSAARYLTLQGDHLALFLHDTVMAAACAAADSIPDSRLDQDVLANHYFNCRLWREEDLVRRAGICDADIVVNKRNIDRFNQQRNDAVERIDVALLDSIAKAVVAEVAPAARLHSETAGMMIDRLSILSLKIYHMKIESERQDVQSEHRAQCKERTERLIYQREDLAGCLEQLLQDCVEGRACFRIYRQFKMYNDPRYAKNLKG